MMENRLQEVMSEVVPVVLLDEPVLDGTGARRPLKLRYEAEDICVIETRVYAFEANHAQWKSHTKEVIWEENNG
jgi:hypothetical protein